MNFERAILQKMDLNETDKEKSPLQTSIKDTFKGQSTITLIKKKKMSVKFKFIGDVLRLFIRPL